MCGYSRVKVRQMVWCLPHQSLTHLTDGPLSLFPSQTWQAEESSRERTPGSVLLLSDFYLSGFTPDPVQVTFSAWRQAFLTRPWSSYGPLWHLTLFWVLPVIKKSQLQQLFCHRSLSRMVFPPKRGQEKVDYWSRAGPMGPRSHFIGHLSSYSRCRAEV